MASRKTLVTGGAGLATAVGLILFMTSLPGVVLEVGPDSYCAGTLADPCYGYFNITVNKTFTYQESYEGAGFKLDKAVSSSWTERYTGSSWKKVSLTKFRFVKGTKYVFRIVALKNKPLDVIKWSVNSAGVEIDPWFFGLGGSVNLSSPENASSYDLNTVIYANATMNGTVQREVIWNWNGTNNTLYDYTLVLAYNFDNRSSLGENQTLAADFSASGNNATWEDSGYANITDGKYGLGVGFNSTAASSGYMRTKSTIALNNVSGATVCAWIKIAPFASSVNQPGVFTQKDNTPEAFIMRVVGSGDYPATYQLACGAPSVPAYNGIINANLWTHVCCKTTGSNLYWYVNGTQTGTAVLAFENITQQYNIGYNGPADSRFNGSIDEIRLWNRSLSDEEIRQSYRSNIARYGPTDYMFNSTQNLSQNNWQYNFTLFTTNATGTTSTGYQYVSVPKATKSISYDLSSGITTFRFLNCSPDWEYYPTQISGQGATGAINVTNNGTLITDVTIHYIGSIATGWTLYASNVTELSPNVTINSTAGVNKVLYGLTAGSSAQVWIFGNCSYVSSNPGVDIDLGAT